MRAFLLREMGTGPRSEANIASVVATVRTRRRPRARLDTVRSRSEDAEVVDIVAAAAAAAAAGAGAAEVSRTAGVVAGVRAAVVLNRRF